MVVVVIVYLLLLLMLLSTRHNVFVSTPFSTTMVDLYCLGWFMFGSKKQIHTYTHRWEDNNNREDPREDPERFVRLVIDGGGGKNRLM